MDKQKPHLSIINIQRKYQFGLQSNNKPGAQFNPSLRESKTNLSSHHLILSSLVAQSQWAKSCLHSRFWPLWPQTGNCQLWPFWQLHIETLDSEPRQGPVWQLHLGASLAIVSLDQNGTTHWHLPLWPQLAIANLGPEWSKSAVYLQLLVFWCNVHCQKSC